MASLKRNIAGQVIFFGLSNGSNWLPVTGAVFASHSWVTVDGGAQANFAGTFAELGNGQYSYVPSQAETNGTSVSIQIAPITPFNTIPASLQFFTDQVDAVGLPLVDVSVVSGTASNVKKNQALANFKFVMLNLLTNAPQTGLAVTATRDIDGSGFVTCANAVTEVGNGWHAINLTAADMNGNVIALRFSAPGTGANDTNLEIITQP